MAVPCVADGAGRHALIYTSYRQLTLGQRLGPDAAWFEVPVATLFERWPPDVDVWLNAAGELGFPLSGTDISAIADLAAGLEVDEAYELGPDDEFTDYPGPSIPDEVDCAVVLALFEVPEVLEVLRLFRRLDEPDGRTWRILLVLVDRDVEQERLAVSVVEAVNQASDECCEVHVANVHDDDVYEAVAHLLAAGVPLWRRQGLLVPDHPGSLEKLTGDGPVDRQGGPPDDRPAPSGPPIPPGDDPQPPY